MEKKGGGGKGGGGSRASLGIQMNSAKVSSVESIDHFAEGRIPCLRVKIVVRL